MSQGPRCKPGQLWKLGQHRLLCGDSTQEADIRRVLQGRQASLVFTDPPYGVNYADKKKHLNRMGCGNRISKPIANDNLGKAGMATFWESVFRHLPTVLHPEGSFYICCASGSELSCLMVNSLHALGIKSRHMLIWEKNGPVLGRGDYNYKHELILYGWMKKHRFYGQGDQLSSVWLYSKPAKATLHPTMKPIGLVRNAVLNSSLRGDIVFDFFLGSGSTLMACEETGRKCIGVEIEPDYCDVILNRWEKFTQGKAELI